MNRDYKAALDALTAYNCVYFTVRDCATLLSAKAGHLRELNQVADVEAGLHKILTRFMHATVAAIKASAGLDVNTLDLVSGIHRAQLQRKLTALAKLDREFDV